MKFTLKYIFFVALAVILIAMCYGFKSVPAKFPDGWIPMYFDQSDAVSCVINTNTIAYIEPCTDTEAILSRSEKASLSYLKVYLNNGDILEVVEPFDEFVERIRRSQ